MTPFARQLMNVVRRPARLLIASTVLLITTSCGSAPSKDSRVLRVDAGSSISDVVSKARPGDIIVIASGTYNESVKVTVPGITIRGEDRNTVILDGQHKLANGFAVVADNVAIENLTVHSFTQNGVLFNGIEAATGGKGVDPSIVYGTGDNVLTGFRVSYVTSYNNGLYGIYAFASRNGVIEESYVSGHPDSGIYIGQCKPCNTVVRRSVAELNAIGYYGTNASGDVYVIESVFTRNRLGIAPNSQRAEELAPQSATVVAGNLVVDNDDPLAPPVPGGYFGVGIAVGGGNENVIVRNRVEGNDVIGIAVIAMNEFLPKSNRIEGNVVSRNGIDMVYSAVKATDSAGNCFTDNEYSTSLPNDIETVMSCTTPTLASVPAYSQPPAPAGGDYRNTPAPAAQPTMPTTAMSVVAGAGTVPVIDVATITVPSR